MIKKIILVILMALLTFLFYQYKNAGPIAGGIALFLFGMMLLGQGFKELTGGGFEKVLKKLTDKTWKSLILGGVGAAVMQSSSLVTIIAISFLSAELIPLAQGIAISIGSNIGTTTGAWIMAQLGEKAGSLSAYAMPIIVFGLLAFIQKSKTLKGIGSILIGIGIVFIGVGEIKSGFDVLSTSIDFKEYAVSGFKGVLLFSLIGVVLTILLQSSHASILIILTALAANQLTLENAFALTIGANIGTTVTAILGAINSNLNGKRLAIADVIFKGVTGIIFIILIYQIIPVIENIGLFLNGFIESITSIFNKNFHINLNSPVFQVAIFHTVFNVVGAIIFLSFYGRFINFIKKIVPAKEIVNTNISRNIYLNQANLEFPETAIKALIKETKHMYDNSIFVILKVFGLEEKDIEGTVNLQDLKQRIKVYDVNIDQLYGEKIKLLFGEIIDYASRALGGEIDEKYYKDLTSIKRANFSITESIKTLRHIQKNLKIFLNSENEEIKKHYENIILDIIFTIQRTKDLHLIKKDEEKIKVITTIEKHLTENDIINNGELDNLIRNKIITNEMATSLMKDTNYKNEICRRLILASEMVFNKEIFDEVEEEKNQSEEIKVSDKKDKKFKKDKKDKKIGKIISKFKKKRVGLLDDLYREKDPLEKEKIEKEIEKIDFILEKYQE